MTVGHRAGDQHQEQRGNELHQADNAEIEGIAGEIIDLPAHGDGNDLCRKAHHEARQPIEQESAMAEGGSLL